MRNFFHDGINTVYFLTNDIDKTIEYYRDFLGLPLYISTKNEEKDWKLYLFSVDKTFSIGFYEWKGYEPLPPKSPGQAVSGPFSFDHLMIGVENEEDLWLIRDKFLMAGLEITDVVDHGFVYSLYTTDPVNNISLEFAYQTYNIYNMPMFMDGAPSALADEGAFPKEKNWSIVNERPSFEKKILKKSIIEVSDEFQLNQDQMSLDYCYHPYNSYYNRNRPEKLFFSFQASNHIIFFATNNMDETIKFYRDLLGFKLINTFGDPNNQFKLYMFAINESLSIAFFYWPTVKSISRKHAGIPYYWWRWNTDSLSLGV
jgi:catechol 2,3-dioxygenase-like lactoylglutathione lyase family enzyme